MKGLFSIVLLSSFISTAAFANAELVEENKVLSDKRAIKTQILSQLEQDVIDAKKLEQLNSALAQMEGGEFESAVSLDDDKSQTKRILREEIAELKKSIDQNNLQLQKPMIGLQEKTKSASKHL